VFDSFPVSVEKTSNVVGHVPRKISAICSLFTYVVWWGYTMISTMMTLNFINSIGNGLKYWVIIIEYHKTHKNLYTTKISMLMVAS